MYVCVYRVWDFSVQGTPTESVAHHSEFVCGIDFNLHDKGQVHRQTDSYYLYLGLSIYKVIITVKLD